MATLLIGPFAVVPSIQFSDHFVIAVDQGMQLLQRHGQPFDVAIGDFDGGEPVVLNESMIIYPGNKDETDLELALQYCQEHRLEPIFAYGFLDANRIDHLLHNLLLMDTYYPLDITYYDATHRIRVYGEGKHVFSPGYHYISFFAFTPAIVSLDAGFAYPIQGYHLEPKALKTISNHVKTTAILTVSKGRIIVIESNGK